MAMQIVTGIKTRDRGRLLIPHAVSKYMLEIYSTGFQGEYGVYLKGTLDPDTLVVSTAPEFMVPVQVVTTGNVSFLEDPPDPSWNVVIHRHPKGYDRFSREDYDFLNDIFLASAIYMPPFGWPMAVINVPVTNKSRIVIPASVEAEFPLMPSEDTLREFNEKVFTTDRLHEIPADVIIPTRLQGLFRRPKAPKLKAPKAAGDRPRPTLRKMLKDQESDIDQGLAGEIESGFDGLDYQGRFDERHETRDPSHQGAGAPGTAGGPDRQSQMGHEKHYNLYRPLWVEVPEGPAVTCPPPGPEGPAVVRDVEYWKRLGGCAEAE